jgi:hypothetical protein
MRAVFIAILAAAALISGCGSGSSAPESQDATLVLDFTPNAIHAGIYSAIARSFDQGEGVNLHVVAPSATTDSIKLLETDRANFAILDIHDLALARQQHKDLVGIMAIVEKPLAAVIAAPQIRNPRQLEGQKVGVTGVPSDTAVLRSSPAPAVTRRTSRPSRSASTQSPRYSPTGSRRRPRFGTTRASRCNAPIPAFTSSASTSTAPRRIRSSS